MKVHDNTDVCTAHMCMEVHDDTDVRPSHMCHVDPQALKTKQNKKIYVHIVHTPCCLECYRITELRNVNSQA